MMDTAHHAHSEVVSKWSVGGSAVMVRRGRPTEDLVLSDMGGCGSAP